MYKIWGIITVLFLALIIVFFYGVNQNHKVMNEVERKLEQSDIEISTTNEASENEGSNSGTVSLEPWQWDLLRELYLQSYELGVLTNKDWATKAQNQDLELSEIIFLQTVIVGRLQREYTEDNSIKEQEEIKESD